MVSLKSFTKLSNDSLSPCFLCFTFYRAALLFFLGLTYVSNLSRILLGLSVSPSSHANVLYISRLCFPTQIPSYPARSLSFADVSGPLHTNSTCCLNRQNSWYMSGASQTKCGWLKCTEAVILKFQYTCTRPDFWGFFFLVYRLFFCFLENDNKAVRNVLDDCTDTSKPSDTM